MQSSSSSSSSSYSGLPINDIIEDYKRHHENELLHIIRKRFNSFKRDDKVKTSTKARAFVDFTDTVEEIQSSKSATPHILLTVNTKPGITLFQLQGVVEAFCLRYLDWAYYAFEIRALPFNGLHVHMLAQIKVERRNTNFSRFKQIFYPSVCGSKHDAIINVKYIDESEFKKCQSYIDKTVVSKAKKAKNDATLEWRDTNGIAPYVIYGDIPSCLSPTLTIEESPEIDLSQPELPLIPL